MRRLRRRILTYSKNFFRNKALVLIYHRVTDIGKDPQKMCVNTVNFEKQIRFLKGKYKILSLQELVNNLKNKRIDNNSIVITFDDGYFDNYEIALPILEKYNVPCTFFITFENIETGKEFWWDQLEQILLNTKRLPEVLKLEIDGVLYKWHECNKNKVYIYEQLLVILKKCNFSAITDIIYKLAEWVGIDLETRSEYRPLNKLELKKLAKNQLVEIGSHSLNHCNLANEGLDKQVVEIKNSKLYLENMLGVHIQSFSYPFGGENHFTEDSVDLVKKTGYDCGISNIQNFVSAKTNLYSIPRFLIRNWGEKEFSRNLYNILHFGPE